MKYDDRYIIVDLDNLAYNCNNIINNYQYDNYMAILKGYGYGHGFGIVKTLKDNGFNYIGVSNIDEALQVRNESNDINILCLSLIPLDKLYLAYKYNIIITISSYDYALECLKLNTKFRVHLKIDTGMNRLGFNNNLLLLNTYEIIRDKLITEGLYSHCANAGIFDNQYDKQLELFKSITLGLNYNDFKLIHIDRSITAITHRNSISNCIRVGILLYGYNPIERIRRPRNIFRKHIDNYKALKFELKPCFSFITSILEIKQVKKGSAIGYGHYFKAKEDIIIGIINAGYDDSLYFDIGYKVSINNKEYSIISVDMKLITILIDDSVNINDDVYLINNNALALATKLNITTYKLLTGINPTIKRFYVKK